jgi:hypothetical protein
MTEYGTFPVINPSDELTTVSTQWGPMEKWRARALAIGWFSGVTHSHRADSAGTHPLHDEDKPPRLAADQVKLLVDEVVERDRRIKDLQGMIDRCDAVEARLDALAKREPSRRALMDAEKKFTVEDPEATWH